VNPVALLLLGVTALSMTVAEFVEFQKLSADELRARFGLSAGCDPAVTAVADSAVNRVAVAVECRGAAAGPPATGGPRPRQDRSTSGGRGS